MTPGKLARLGAAMVLTVGAAGGILGLSGSAYAAGRASSPAYYQQEHFIRYDQYTSPPEVVAENYLTCPPPIHECGLQTTIYQDESGTWVEVATGNEIAVVYCSGSFMTTYKDQSGDEVTAPCS
jgi:hypothetical protein